MLEDASCTPIRDRRSIRPSVLEKYILNIFLCFRKINILFFILAFLKIKNIFKKIYKIYLNIFDFYDTLLKGRPCA